MSRKRKRSPPPKVAELPVVLVPPKEDDPEALQAYARILARLLAE